MVLARALCGRPDLLLLDEPYTALDSSGRALVTEVLRAEKKRGTGVLLSAHDLTVVADVTDRAVRLDEGLIVGEVARITAEDPGGAAYLDRISSLAAGVDQQEQPRA